MTSTMNAYQSLNLTAAVAATADAVTAATIMTKSSAQLGSATTNHTIDVRGTLECSPRLILMRSELSEIKLAS